MTIPLFPLHELTADLHCSRCGPSCENPGKHPVYSWTAEVGGERFATIDEYLDARPSVAGVGARMGEGVFVLDIDPRSDGFEALARLEDEFDTLPATAVALTGEYDGERGEHRYYRHDPDIYVRKTTLARAICSEYEGIDVQAEGSFVVVPPSPHKSGVRYEWQTPLDRITEAPAWLLTLLCDGSFRPTARQSNGEARRRTGRRLSRRVERWIFDEGIPAPQWENISTAILALWDDTEQLLSADEIGELIYEALVRSPDYDPDRPWSKAERIRDVKRFLAKPRRHR